MACRTRHDSFQGSLSVFIPRPVNDVSHGQFPACSRFTPNGQAKGSWLIHQRSTATLSVHTEEMSLILRFKLATMGSARSAAAAAECLLDFSVNMFSSSCVLKLIPGAWSKDGARSSILLLGFALENASHHLAMQQQQVIAFKFSSHLDAQAFHEILQLANERQQSARQLLQGSQHPLGDRLNMQTQGAGQPQDMLIQSSQQQEQQHMHMDAVQELPNQFDRHHGHTPVPASTVHPLLNLDTDMAAPLQPEELQLQMLIEKYVAQPGFMQYVDLLQGVWERMEDAAAKHLEDRGCTT